jgi:ribosomal protein L44E
VPGPGPARARTRVAAPAGISSTRARVHPTGERSPRKPCTAGDAKRRHSRRAERAGGAEKPRAEARAYPGPEVRVRTACAMTDAGGAHANTHRLRPNRQARGGQVECRACKASRVGASGGQ